jgi:hypothetical protein
MLITYHFVSIPGRDYRQAKREMSIFLRSNRRRLVTVLPQLAEKIRRLPRDTIEKKLVDDLKVFADAVMKLLGESYFLMTTNRREKWLTAPRFLEDAGDDWRALALETVQK